MSDALHPNLARLAHEYDQIVNSFLAGKLDRETAYQRISELEARDDEGIRWSFDPQTGGWVRRDLFGHCVPDTPPTWGMATATGHDWTDPAGEANPDHALRHVTVGDVPNRLNPLIGSTRRRLGSAAGTPVSARPGSPTELAARRTRAQAAATPARRRVPDVDWAAAGMVVIGATLAVLACILIFG